MQILPPLLSICEILGGTFFLYFHRRLNAQYLKCLNRGDIGPELFKKKISENNGIKRRNLNRLITTNSTHVLCNQTTYSFDQLCGRTLEVGNFFKRPCLVGTGETIEL